MNWRKMALCKTNDTKKITKSHLSVYWILKFASWEKELT